MPFEIVRNDITNMRVDAIVNSANPRPVVGLGTDSSIHEKAGPELLTARQKIGPIAMGQAAITPAFRLHAKCVIHTVGPVWDGGSYGEEGLLRSCYDQSLKLALEHDCKSIAFPLIATNNYDFPKDKALQIAVAAFSEFLLEHEMLIYLVVFDRGAYKLSEKLFHSIASYIDDHYVDLWEEATYGVEKESRRYSTRRRRDRDLFRKSSECEDAAPCAPMAMPMAATPKPASLKDLLSQADAGFTETLLKLIDKTGKKDSEIYKKANLSKQHFSKIRNNPDYKPTKQTAIALALALELDLEQTKDLIGRAGYALSNSSKFDLIIRYCTVPEGKIDEFLISKGDFIRNAQDKFKEQEQYRPLPKQYVSGETFYIQGRALRLKVTQTVRDKIYSDGVYLFLDVKDQQDIAKKERMVKRFLDKQCKAVFSEIVAELYPVFQKYGVALPTLRIRNMDTRWGSCLPGKGIITLNKRLLEAPRNCIEYVVMHEFCHFIHPNHSKHFYDFLAMLMPDWKERKKVLDSNAAYYL